MPTIDENRRNWDRDEGWEDEGHEWSRAWGSTESLWYGSVLPRLAPFLPAEHLLEIACGRGRITAFLLDHCERYTGVDLAPSCVEACRQRFGSRPGASFATTDGRSLPEVAAGSVDLAVSWDSLVHADREAVAGYVGELARVLRPGGAAFLHHSNFAELMGRGVENLHWRDETMSAAVLRELCARHPELECPAQEVVQWGTEAPIDCFSLLRRMRPGETRRETRVQVHPGMAQEIEHFRVLDLLYRRSVDGSCD